MKKDKRKNKKGNKLWLKLILALLLVGVVILLVFGILNKEDSDTGLTILEKQWIEKNKQDLIDFNIPNNLSVLGENGEGVLFDLLDNLENDTSLQFNKIAYNYPSADNNDSLGFVVLKNDDKIRSADIIVAEDSYILLGRENKYILDINTVNNVYIGVLSGDEELITNYFSGKNVVITPYSNAEALYNDLLTSKIAYACLPRYANLSSYSQKNGIYTNYNLSNITNKIVLRLGENEKLNKILSKYIEDYKDLKFKTTLETYLMNFYTEHNNLTAIEKANFTSKRYKYGFVKGDVYNVKKQNKLYGIAGEYINSLSNMANIEFEFIEYNNKDMLIKDFENNNIDIAFINFDYENDNALSTSSPFALKMIALSNTYQNVSNSYGLSNHKLYLFKDNYLYEYIKENTNSNIKEINSISYDLGKDGILILDESNYLYYKENNLSNLKELFVDYYNGNLRYIVNSNDETLYNITNFLLNNTDYNEYRNAGINNLLNTMTKENKFKTVYLIILLVVFIPILIIVILTVINKLKNNINKFTKEEVLKYTDMLTSLKNRNYLNLSINSWDETKIYPRTIIIIDLNNLKYVNDNYGQKEGNELIKKAAAILINTQLEKSEIIRTDGNEFLIYLIGYSKHQINTYISKLNKEFENLPHNFGAAIGYSIITDEIKTVDDAINEATINMRIDKEKNYKS